MPRQFLLAIALLAGGGLVVEIALTRVLSFMYFYHYVYTVLALAVLGLGLGAALATWKQGLCRREYLPAYASLAGLSVFGLVALMLWDTAYDIRLLVIAGTLLPYTFIGLALATAFALKPVESPRLYWADLAGAGLGAAGAVPLLAVLGGLGGLLAGAAFIAASGILFVSNLKGKMQMLVLAFLVVIGAGHHYLGWLEIDPAGLATPKPLREALRDGAEPLKTRWDALARTDLVRGQDGSLYLFMDGGATSLVPDVERLDALLGDVAYFPLALTSPGRVATIGPGGGLDVALARAGGAKDILAVELNRAKVELVRGLGGYSGHVYDGSDVQVLIDDGRAALRASPNSFDLILLSHVVAQAADLSGYALIENTLYTREAFGDYLGKLAPGGLLAVKLYDEVTLTRAFMTALAALSEGGRTEAQAAGHLVVLLDPLPARSIPLLMVFEQPLPLTEAARITQLANRLGFAPLYVPGAVARPPLDALLAGQTTLDDIVRASREVDISPTTDAQPFFFQFEPGLPGNLQLLLILSALLLPAPLFVSGTVYFRGGRAALWVGPLLFAALGFGFMAAEIGVLQHLRLLLGQPTLALSTVLGGLLVGGGFGSLAAARVSYNREAWVIAVSSFVIALLLPLWWAAFTFAYRVLPGLEIWERIGFSLAMVLPIGFLLGIPFPLALRMFGRIDRRQVPLGFAMSGAYTMAAGVITVALAVLNGFPAVIWAGGFAYVSAACLAIAARRLGLT